MIQKEDKLKQYLKEQGFPSLAKILEDGHSTCDRCKCKCSTRYLEKGAWLCEKCCKYLKSLLK